MMRHIISYSLIYLALLSSTILHAADDDSSEQVFHEAARDYGQPRVAALDQLKGLNPQDEASAKAAATAMKAAGANIPESAFTWMTDIPVGQSTHYAVDDFASELGFWMDMVGMKSLAAGSGHMMLQDQQERCTIVLHQSSENMPAMPANTLKMEFVVADAAATRDILTKRSVVITKDLDPEALQFGMAYFEVKSPAGITIAFLTIPRREENAAE